MKILHFAAENYARVPGTMVRAERRLGHESVLMTLFPSSQATRDEDVCLRLPFTGRKRYLPFLKRHLLQERRSDSCRRKKAGTNPPVWEVSNGFVSFLFSIRDRLWEGRIRRALRRIDIDTFDVIFLDGGLGFLRSGKIVQELKKQEKKIVVGYYGSDLRTRGIIPHVDALADYRFTVEFDHTILYPGLEYIFAPFEWSAVPQSVRREDGIVRIGHAPTNRRIKGTDAILSQLFRLKELHPIEIVLMENLPYEDALALKGSCDLFVDTLGELGYGMSGLEALAMGIPTAVQLLPDYEKIMGDHPFINVSEQTLVERLIPFVESEALRKEFGEKGKTWVRMTHDPLKVVGKIMERIAEAPSS